MTDEQIPYVAFGNEEIEKSPDLQDPILCTRCGEHHNLEYGKKELPDGTWIEDNTLAFIKCGDNSYLVGITGKDIRPIFKRK
jgi:hypothetical protein